LTIQRLHCSEVGRWRKAEETLASLRAAVAPGGQVVLESTPQGTWGAFYREWQTAGESGFVQHFFPWWLEPAYQKTLSEPLKLEGDEPQLVEMHGLTMEQIAYRRELKATHKRHTRQEYAEDAETCFLASGDCVFDLDRLDERVAQCTHYDEREKLWEFLPALPGKKYIIGVDACGGGSEGDYACAQVIDENGVQVAELLARLTPEELAREVGRLAWRYNDAFFVVERNSHGLEVLAHLRNAKAQLYVDQKGKQGFETNLKTRPLLVAGLVELVAEHSELLQSRRLLRQMRSFVRNRGGKAEAAPGEHDDAVMAMGVAQWVRQCDWVRKRQG
jgi:hypothetical protein